MANHGGRSLRQPGQTMPIVRIAVLSDDRLHSEGLVRILKRAGGTPARPGEVVRILFQTFQISDERDLLLISYRDLQIAVGLRHLVAGLH